ncbi:hypothetical protein, partial [Streptomyces sp. NPDC029704]|uniref:hypothetical protein n=1 Tax=Streptomyces sp. NPDC029704 TaxID=3156920 RepID=UPI00340BBE11
EQQLAPGAQHAAQVAHGAGCALHFSGEGAAPAGLSGIDSTYRTLSQAMLPFGQEEERRPWMPS